MKESEKIYKQLEKKYRKNKNKLLKLCKKYYEEEDTDLLQDIILYANTVFDDEQSMLLITICKNDYGEDSEE